MTRNRGLSWSENRGQLRTHAEGLIHNGSATVAPTGGSTLGVAALELLYRRASNPEFAADALKLLHELQTHQVEIDMLLEQMQTNEKELTDELSYYEALYWCAPAAYLVVGLDGRVIESNEAAAALLDFGAGHPQEQTLTHYLSPASRTAVASMMRELQESGAPGSCRAQLADRPDHQLLINARLCPSEKTVLMIVSQDPAPVPGATRP